MWVPVPIPTVPRPIWGVIWSDRDRLLVLGGGGLVELSLSLTVSARTVASVEVLRRVFDPDRDTWLIWEGREYFVQSRYVGGGKICHPNGDRIILDENDELAVSDINGKVIRQVLGPVRLFDGDDDSLWSVTDFTDDDQHIVSFDADELRVYRLTPDAEPGAAADGGA
jgi:hypothetical protein